MSELRKITLFVIIGVVALSINAQTLYKSHVHIGVRGGATMSSMSFSPSVEQSMVNGVTGGFTFRYAEERHVGLVAEFNIAQRGWKESFDEGEPFEYSRKLTYLQIPVMTHIFFGSQRFKGFINLGPEVSYLIGNSVNANFDYNNVETVTDFPTTNRMTEQLSMDVKNKFDYGITAGLGMEYKLNRKHSISLEGRYYFGLGNIFPSSKKDVFDASRHSSIMITLGYHYRIK